MVEKLCMSESWSFPAWDWLPLTSIMKTKCSQQMREQQSNSPHDVQQEKDWFLLDFLLSVSELFNNAVLIDFNINFNKTP